VTTVLSSLSRDMDSVQDDDDDIFFADDGMVDDQPIRSRDDADGEEGVSPPKKSKFHLVSDDGEYRIPMSESRVVEFVRTVKEDNRRRKRKEAALAAFRRLYDYEPASMWEERMIAEWTPDQPLKILDVSKIQSRNVMLGGQEEEEVNDDVIVSAAAAAPNPVMVQTDEQSLTIANVAKKTTVVPPAPSVTSTRNTIEPDAWKVYDLNTSKRPTTPELVEAHSTATEFVVVERPARPKRPVVLESRSPASNECITPETRRPKGRVHSMMDANSSPDAYQLADKGGDASSCQDDPKAAYLKACSAPDFLEHYSEKKRAYLQLLKLDEDAEKMNKVDHRSKACDQRKDGSQPPPAPKYWADFIKLAADLTPAELEMLRERCYRGFVTTPSGHMMLAVRVRSGTKFAPPQLRFSLRGVPLSLYRRSLSLFLRLHEELGHAPEWPSDKKCAVICGQNKLCIAPTHLSLEKAENVCGRVRAYCHRMGQCQKHDGLPDCIISCPKTHKVASSIPE